MGFLSMGKLSCDTNEFQGSPPCDYHLHEKVKISAAAALKSWIVQMSKLPKPRKYDTLTRHSELIKHFE